MLPKLVSKGSLSCQRSLTLAALAGHQRLKKTVLLFILAHLKLAMGIMHLKRCSCGIKTDSGAQMNTHWSYLETGKTNSKGYCTHSAHTQTSSSLTLVWQLANIGGDSHVQHVIDSRVNVVSSLDIMFTVGLVALLVAAVLQTVPLQVFECRRATWGPTGRRGKILIKCHITYFTCFPSSPHGLWRAVCLSLLVPFTVFPINDWTVVYFQEFKTDKLCFFSCFKY